MKNPAVKGVLKGVSLDSVKHAELQSWRKEAIGQKTRMLFKMTFPDSLENVVHQLRRGGKWSGELIHHAKDGHEVIVQSFWLAVLEKKWRCC